ncbi:hypothetical protein [Pseudoduganella albidiflava]|uniref:PEP-CTERM sorting domain-containing protein n=1 Tax=Pseudoduganella albidiflava TaxID=321983 RepID=A0A411WUC8_9BURK|nr:hypothetical protein [Pseudoduganella albidiflava]QBI00239.1 hypothetical protein EYF70_04765 [Pseudoduganella albidiflava]GGY52357.1 hypothetical protein GCM10007387_38210 [Pseudoduganella albidiflava]
MRVPPRLIPLMLALAVSQAYAAPTVTGAAGADGTHASLPGTAGSAAGHGEDATATAGAGDPGAVATGGQGGRGGDGAAGAPGQAGGKGGNGGHGGHATASHAVQSSAAQLLASALAAAGRGGDPGIPGEGGAGAARGPQGTGGRGGNATASVTATGSGTITATSAATGGTSGYLAPIGAGERFGSAIANTTVDGGSSATVTADADATAGAQGGGNAAATLHATGYQLSLGSKVTGGSGAYHNGLTGLGGNDGGSATGKISGTAGLGGASALLTLEGGAGGSGANGADVVARNPFDVTTTGRLSLSLSGKGGDAGSANPGATGGRAGNADLELVLDDPSASSLAMRVRATGGAGSLASTTDSGQATRGGHASAKLQGTTKGEIELVANATGGAGGASRSGAAGNGGDALAAASGTTHLPPRWGSRYPGDVSAVAVGGAGGISWSDGVRAGDGGTAQASASVHSRTVYEFDLTEARALATGGAGGKATTLGGIAGNGGAVSLVDSVGGSAASRLELRQEAYGGAGGLHTGGGVGGSGGAALSQLTLADAVTPALTVDVLAHGGHGAGGNGGGAQAILELASTSIGAAVRGNTHAKGGDAGMRALAGDALARSTVRAAGQAESRAYALAGETWNPGAQSAATAFSRAEAGGAATALADADAETEPSNPGIARARAESISTGGSSTAFAKGRGRIFDISAHSQASGSAASRATVEGSRGDATALATSTSTGSGMRVETTAGAKFASRGYFGFEARTSIGSTVAGQAYHTGSFANALPVGAVIPAGAPTVAAALEGQPIAAVGRMLGVSTSPAVPGAHHLTTASFRFDTLAPGALTLGLLDFRSAGIGFTELELIVSNHGSELFSWTFDSLAAAQAFFDDNVLDLGMLGAGSQDILIAADFTFGASGRFDFDYVLGAQGLAPVPEPQVWMLMLLGLTVLLVRARPARR